MESLLLNFHRFLARQSFYPLVLSSLMSTAILAGRVFVGHSWDYNNLLWNLFLAWIPYLCSMGALLLYKLFPRQWWLLLMPGAIWLAFFPNAPYIVTDFLHLREQPPVPLWYDIGLLATFSWTGCFLAIASLRTMQYLTKKYLGGLVSWIFVMASLVLSGLGIYLGRFGRWNSWDLLFHTRQVVNDILIRVESPFNNLRFVGFTLMFTAFLTICYLMFSSVSRLDEPATKQEPVLESPVEKNSPTRTGAD